MGDGDERLNLEALAIQLGIAGKGQEEIGTVEFSGWLAQAECAARLKRADCLVLPSLLECGGAVVLEAMSMGKPVIATAWGGPLDYLDQSCGVLIPPQSRESMVDGFSAAMVEMARSGERRRSLGANGMAKVRREYDWESKADRMLVIYLEAVGQHRTAPSAR